ncbi:unnamed protein product [Cylicostephanus goldi]|uniref:RNase H type-1 domain-containing protein n=1 Tax=Cylicostephanus goldi TaxID=71465 RepID=A0A3P6SMC0_CYLGO|nr:unnamed protein product [Cylicostephanus goldi]
MSIAEGEVKWAEILTCWTHLTEDVLMMLDREYDGKMISESTAITSSLIVWQEQRRNYGFTAASFAAVWSEKRFGIDIMERLAMVPATLVRAQLAAIEAALKEAVENSLPRVVVITDSQVFMHNWKNKWSKANGTPCSNKFLYDRIRDLVQEGTEVVRFRFEIPRKDSSEWLSAIDKCFESIDLPIVGKDRSEYDRNISEILVDEKFLRDPRVKVRIFKRGTDFHSGVVWEEDSKSTECFVKEEKRVYHYLLDVLERAASEGIRDLRIRTDSARLVLSAENWLPIWHRNGWRNSLHKPIADAALWKKIWSLKKKVKV